MGSLRYAFGMLAAGGALGVASNAAAEIKTFDIAWTDPPVGLELITGEAPQFFYGGTSFSIKTKGKFTSSGPDAYVGSVTDDPSLPGPSTVFFPSHPKFGPNKVVTASAGPVGPPIINVAEQYVHLAFVNNGTKYVGSAYFDAEATLKQVEFEEGNFLVAVPEPEAWALLIGGFGLAGAALRRRRQLATA